MQQLNIVYFWPLTEQISLDLNYTECKQSSIYMSEGSSAKFGTGSTLTVNATGTSWVTINSSRLDLDVDTTVIKSKTKPPLIRRWLYKLLGLKWEIK
jgi:hypothetical protein